MLREFIEVCKRNKLRTIAAVLFVALVLYVCGLTAPLIVLLPLVLTVGMRFPAVIKSWLAKFLISTMVLYSLIQVGATIQFLIAPNSTFALLAFLTTVASFLMIVFFPAREAAHSFASKTDLYALLCAAPFMLPMLVMALLGNGQFLAEFGGIQGIDGVNHFASIAEMTKAQHFTYKVGSYYPNGFHIATGFIQSGLGIIQSNFSWLVTAKLYIMQYVIFGSLMLYSLYYFAISLKISLAKKLKEDAWITSASALTIGGIVSVLYFTSFMYHGFLSYFYICTAILIGALYLFDAPVRKLLFNKSLVESRFTLASLFLIVSLGASMSWPLWTPALLLVALLFALGEKITKKSLLSISALGLVITALLHFLPIYFQLKYSGADGSQGINLLGGLRTFHVLVVLAGVVVLGCVLLSKNIEERGKTLLQQLFIPIVLLLFLIVAMQYFGFGEVRYYSIKTSLFVEIILITLAVVFVSVQYEKPKQNDWYILAALPILAFISVSLLMSVNGGTPFQDGRQLFRIVSAEPKPPFYENDTQKLSDLGMRDVLKGANAVSLHKNDAGKLFAHTQMFYFADMMDYTGTQEDRKTLAECDGQIYGNLFRQDFSDSAQADLIATIKKCAAEYNAKGVQYYIVTDDASRTSIESIFGKAVRVI